MSLQDSLFSEDAEGDLQHFLKSEKRKRVLIFPPVNNYRRFLIHQLVQDRYGDLLHTFSIGQGLDRRTVVCYKSDFLGPPQVNGVSSQITGNFSFKMGIENQCTPTASPEHSSSRQRPVKSTPAYEIYRPPAARRSRLEKSPTGPAPTEQTTSDTCASKINRQKRPDRAVYVPRHRRTAMDADNNTPGDASSKSPREPRRVTSKRPIDRTVNEPDTLTETLTTKTDDTPRKIVDEVASDESSIVNNPVSEETKEDTSSTETPILDTDSNIEKAEEEITEKMPMIIDSNEEKMDEDSQSDIVISKDPLSVSLENNVEEKIDVDSKSDDLPACLGESDKRDRRKSLEYDDNCSMKSETETASLNSTTERCSLDNICDNKTVEQESETEKNIQNLDNQSSKQEKKVVKQTLVSKVLIISSSDGNNEIESAKPEIKPVPMTPPEKKVKKIERAKSKPVPPPLPHSKLNRDECDWDSLFDDNGDCLDPTLVDELTSSVGEVVIEKPKSNYKPYTQPVEVSNDEFAHVVEIYNFPSDFKSSDLAAVFSAFKNGGFELKWVDDTHCLGVFSSPLAAAEVLASDHPLVKTRPLSEATPLSKTKARKSCEFLQPYKTRPQTCAALARRLVTKSLGVTLSTARQEREREKIVLREAKEKRRLANKQREEIWEGIVSEKPTT